MLLLYMLLLYMLPPYMLPLHWQELIATLAISLAGYRALIQIVCLRANSSIRDLYEVSIKNPRIYLRRSPKSANGTFKRTDRLLVLLFDRMSREQDQSQVENVCGSCDNTRGSEWPPHHVSNLYLSSEKISHLYLCLPTLKRLTCISFCKNHSCFL